MISVLVLVTVAVQLSPYLVSSKQDGSIGLYNEREYGKGNLTLATGEIGTARFNYTIYDPAILILDLTFQSWQKPGYLTLSINGRKITSIFANPEEAHLNLNVITFSGTEWVKPSSIDAFTYGNELVFQSEAVNGFEGTFGYEIKIRGSV